MTYLIISDGRYVDIRLVLRAGWYEYSLVLDEDNDDNYYYSYQYYCSGSTATAMRIRQ